jgi:tungstate transport system substrate-binding protein
MEKDYWKKAGIEPKGQPWYVSAGLGMGEVLTMAAQLPGYTLSDRATYGAYRAKTAWPSCYRATHRCSIRTA